MFLFLRHEYVTYMYIIRRRETSVSHHSSFATLWHETLFVLTGDKKTDENNNLTNFLRRISDINRSEIVWNESDRLN